MEARAKEVYVDHVMQSVSDIIRNLSAGKNVSEPDEDEIQRCAERFGVRTTYGSVNFVSSVKNRSAWLTVIYGSSEVLQREVNPSQSRILREMPRTIEKLRHYTEWAPFVRVRRNMGENHTFVPQCHYYISTHHPEMMKLAHMVSKTLFPLEGGKPGPVMTLIQIPEWQERDRQIIVFPEMGVTFVLGSDYYGEAKKGFLRMGMWFAKRAGMLGLHAGTKVVKANSGGTMHGYGVIIFGLTSTGKTTHSCHDHFLDASGEGATLLQDDVVFLMPNFSALGTERGFYLKTDVMKNAKIGEDFRSALLKSETILDNVMVDHAGAVHFEDDTLTGNGRAVVQRKDFGKLVNDTIDLPSPGNGMEKTMVLLIVRRNTVVPPLSRLTTEQASAAFMLGESVESTGGDPNRAGQPVREVGTNPFIIGDYAEEGNRFYEFLRGNKGKVECYMLNTGGVGELTRKDENGVDIVVRAAKKIEFEDSALLIKAIFKGWIEWKQDTYFSCEVPSKVEGYDISKFDLSHFYSEDEVERLVQQLKAERRKWLSKFQGIDSRISSQLC